MIGTRTEASKITFQAHEMIGSLTVCEDKPNAGIPIVRAQKKSSVFLKRR